MPPAGVRYVGPSGPRTARIVIVGEAPGKHEDEQGRPFVGPSGWRLDAWLAQAGLRREDCYITNTYKFRPPNNRLTAVPAGERQHWIDALHQELAGLTDPYVIVPTGDVALRALTGHPLGIMATRGFVLAYDMPRRPVKVIPTIHPAATFRLPYLERRCQLDWRRIATEATDAALRLPSWTHHVDPTLSDLASFYDEVRRKADVLSLDIETFGGVVSCVGFSYTGSMSVTVPTLRRDWPSDAAYAAAWESIRALCALPVPKALQHGTYDWYWLADFGITPVAWEWDCGAMHHALDAADDHNLNYMASMHLRMGPWKHIPKDSEARLKFPSDAHAVRVYNGIDCVVQWQLADMFARRLGPRLPFYQRHYRDLFLPLLSLMQHGINHDEAMRGTLYSEFRAECEAIQAELQQLTDCDLRGAKNKKREAAGKMRDLSTRKLQDLFYRSWRLPQHVKRRATGESTPTLDEVAIRQIMQPLQIAAEETGNELAQVRLLVCQHILEHRSKKKLSEFLDAGRFDPDGRMRSSYGFAPETGRLSSSKNPKRGGANAQNQSRRVRRVFIPDTGCVFVECDLSQAEDRIVKCLTASLLPTGSRQNELLWRARAEPWENDEHLRAAAAIFGRSLDDVTAAYTAGDATAKRQRFFGKKSRHASNYGEGGKHLSEDLLKEGVVITPREGDRMIAAVIDHDVPEIREWQAEIRRRILRERRLANEWGRELLFEFDRLDDETFRRGYAFLPQSAVPALLNQHGHRPLWEAIRCGALRAAVNANVHDSLLMSVPAAVDDVWTLYRFLSATLRQRRTYWGVELVIPIEWKVGLNWGFAPGVEFKRPVTRDEIAAALETLAKESHHGDQSALSPTAERGA